MRLFVAVDLEESIRQSAAQLVEQLQHRVKRQAPAARVTWAAADRMHITLRFIGGVDPPRAESVAALLRPALDAGPFAAAIAGVGAFPRSGPPRVLWAGITEGRDRLIDLEREVSARLAPAGPHADRRPYQPHLTLGRVREAAGLRSARLLEGLPGTELGATHVQAITLYESRLSPRGSLYVPIQRTRLGPVGRE